MYTCSFIGHHNCPSSIKPKLTKMIQNLITQNGVTRFYIGTQGNFDKLSYQVLSELENEFNIEIFVVLAYLNKTEKDSYYDPSKTIFPDVLSDCHPRYAIKKKKLLYVR